MSTKIEVVNQEKIMQEAKLYTNGLKYHINTMGCKLNENDSEKIAGMLEEMGYELTDKVDDANIVVFNTCCIRENAEEKLYGKLGELKNIKAQNNMIICVGGCMSQEEHVVEKLRKSYPHVDVVFGTHNTHMLPEMVLERLKIKKRVYDVWDVDGDIYEGLPIKRTSPKNALVTIMYGCNNFCSYCIVPYTRGRERSRRYEDILNEIKILAKDGCKEIMLLGQNVNSYDGGNGYKFANLLRDIDKIEGIDIVRFMSPHPKDFTDDVIDAIAECKSVCKVIHLPLQSGSTNVLKLMNRKYTKEQYLTLVNKIREKVPDVSFTTDIIVGFPGETEEDFEDTLDVVSKVNFEQVFMFIYSVRKGTVAERMENHIPEEIKSARFDKLKSLADSMTMEDIKKYVGTVQKILIEGESRTNPDVLTGRTRSNRIVNFVADKSLIGKEVNINITAEKGWYLTGEVVE